MSLQLLYIQETNRTLSIKMYNIMYDMNVCDRTRTGWKSHMLITLKYINYMVLKCLERYAVFLTLQLKNAPI